MGLSLNLDTGGGSNGTSLSFGNLVGEDNGSHRLVVTNEFGSVTSGNATVGLSHTMSVVSIGSEERGYQWQKNGIEAEGATGISLTLANIQSGDAGKYKCIITNEFGVATTNKATITVMPP